MPDDQIEDKRHMYEASSYYRPRLRAVPKRSSLSNFLGDLLAPTKPKEGPPLPESLGIQWPGFFGRGIQRIITEGPLSAFKTIKNKGFKEEFKRELELLTGKKYTDD
jgi:hypothetical protein